MDPPLRTVFRLARLVILLMSFAAIIGCRQSTSLPSEGYKNIVRAFYVGLAALEVGDDVRADAKLSELVKLAPNEPAGWGNWGLLALRQRDYDAASQRLEGARSLAPDNAQIYYLIGLLESSRGQSSPAISALRKAIELDPKHLKAIYRLAEEVERQADENSEAEYQSLIKQILAAQPDNLAALLELARISARRGDTATLKTTIAKIARDSSSWPPEVQEQLTALESAAAGPDPGTAATRTVFLRNVLVRVPVFRRSLEAIKPPPGDEATPFRTFLKLESPSFAPAIADTALTFTPQSVDNVPDGRWTWAGAISLGDQSAPVLAIASGRDLHLTSGVTMRFPGGPSAEAPGPEGILPIDFDYDFKTDLVLTGAGGLRLWRQDRSNAFTDVTSLAKLSPATTGSALNGAWSADIEADGDLDIVLGMKQGAPTVLRNNGDGTFVENYPFGNISGLSGFAWADVDADGDPDAALIDGAGRLHIFLNERTGIFIERAVPKDISTVRAISVADVDRDGVLDFVVVQADNQVVSLSDHNEGETWLARQVISAEDVGTLPEGDLRLRVADLDNNGGLDLILVSGTRTAIWLSDERGEFQPLKNPGGSIKFFDTADVNSDGRLDLIGLSESGHLLNGINKGEKNYHWQVIRPRAKQAVGDQRINSFGIGGEMEIRSGLLTQKQPITSPMLHFGLGEQAAADVVRIVWPNGSVRAEFELPADQEIVAEQRLKGSCPFLFAFNGREMRFVKDAAPWGSAIGLRINTLGTARVEATEEWFKIGRDQLVARDGYYDLRITAELWETYYYDHVSLMAVDHPEGTEIFVDERFVVPPAKLAITTVSTPRKISRAIDDTGQDVTDVLSALDGNYVDTFGRGKYQGVTRDHYVEVDLGDDDRLKEGPLWLIAHGWMHPTDSSINVAISQGQQEKAKPLSLEVPDGRGGWRVARANLGFPAGRNKICLFDLTGVFKPGTPRRLRLRTNLEVYWDLLEWSPGVPESEPIVVRMNPQTADLRYRGYSVINQANDSSPEIPDYNRLFGSKQRWRDLIGYYTRFGDVRELLNNADDRYVIMNAGDELLLRFIAPPPPRAGWVRDYVIVGDGWIKDGDYNSTFSKTVLPLPYHQKNKYVTAPGRLEDEWVYKRYPNDWQTYHTRYLTADIFQNALRSR